MQAHELIFFTHTIEGKSYGGWYRLLSPSEVEVIALGLIRTVPCVGVKPEDASRWCLEDLIKGTSTTG